MDAEQRARLARQLSNNPLLPELLAERQSEITDEWASEKEPDKRELCWFQLQASIDFGDYLYAKLNELERREPAE